MKTAKNGLPAVFLFISCVGASVQAAVLEEVIVTSQKRSENLQDVPIAVNAFTADMIQEMGITNAQELAMLTPSMHTITIGNPMKTSIRVRGIGTAQSDPALEPSVGVFVDGVFLGRSGLAMSDLTDIERIEVLQGPQGTLYGKNTNAGAISIVTKRPSLEGFEGYVNVAAGNYSMHNVTVAATGPISETVAFRISGNIHERDGFIKNIGPAVDGDSVDDWNIQAKLLWEPSENLSVLFSAAHVDRDTSCCAPDATQGPQVLGLVAQGLLPDDGNDPYDYVINTDFDSIFKLESDMLSLNLTYDFAWGSLSSITSYDEFEYSQTLDNDRGPLAMTLNEPDYNAGETFSQELRLTSTIGSAIDYVVGLFYYDQEIKTGDGVAETFQFGPDIPYVRTPLANVGDSAYGKAVWQNDTLAAFGQITWHVTDRLQVTGGLRWTREERDADILAITSFKSDRPIPPAAWAINRFTTPIDETFNRSNNDVNWLVSASYDLSQEAMIYASTSTGSKSGGFNSVNGSPEEREFDYEDTISYELGLKSTLFDSRLRLNTAIFHTEVDNYQYQARAATGVGTYVSNEAEIEVSGLDLQIDAQPLDNLSLSAGLMYMNDFEVVSGPNTGDPLGLVSEYTLNLGGTLFFPLSDGGLYLRGDYLYMSDHEPANKDDDIAIQNRELVNARVGWRNDKWNVALWGKNLTDETYAGFTSRLQQFSGSRAFFLQPPRTYGVEVRLNF